MLLKYSHIKNVLLIVILLCNTLFVFSQNYTVSGYIVDEESRETIIGATVLIKGSTIGCSTDRNGYFQLSVNKTDKLILQFSHVSYKTIEKIISIDNKSMLLGEIALQPVVNSLDEISVIGIKPDEIGDKEIETSQIQLTPKAIESIPTARNDVFKAIRFLPGIEGTEAFSPLYSVRGGDPGENKVLLDGVTIYNPYHFSTSSGIFNVQTIKNIDVFIGGYGAEFGGSNSSILHITTKEGNKNELHGEFFPSLMQSKLLLEFPAGNNASVMIGGRYFYDIQSAFMLYNNSYFYDFNFSYSNRINNKNWLSIKLFSSKDNTLYEFGKFFGYMSKSFDLEELKDLDMGINNKWKNFAAIIALKKILTPGIYFNTQVYYSTHYSSNYSYFDFLFNTETDEEPLDVKLYYNTMFKSLIRDYTIKSNFNIKAGRFNTFKTGIEKKWYIFENLAILNKIEDNVNRRIPEELSAFIEDKIKIGPVIMRPGVRFSNNDYIDKYYFEPRFNMNIHLTANTMVKAAYGIYYQYIVSMNTMEYEINQLLDYYYPLKNVLPSKSIHYIAGFEQSIYSNNLTLTGDLYYKDISRIYTFDLLQSQSETFGFSDKIQAGTGKAYGFEIMIKGTLNKFSGWIGYSYSKSFRSFPYIMNGEEYPYEYNRTNAFKTLINYQVNPRLSYSTTFLFMSGPARTLESALQNYHYYNPVNGDVSFYPIYTSGVKNNAHLPSYIEWDIGLKKRLRSGFGAELQDFLHADESYLNFTLGNLLFLKRNVIWYLPLIDENKYLPLGVNYLPYINFGYILKF